jgi:vacuolar-type H+-ATPase subunit H
MIMGEPNQFRVGLRGYDRAQVDGYVAAHSRWATEAWNRVNALEARLSELDGSPVGVRLDQEEANQLLKKAESDKSEAERIAAEIVEAAHARAQEISQETERDREKAAQSVLDARQQVDGFVDEAKAASEALVHCVSDSNHTYLEELHRRLDSFEEQRRATLAGLSGIWDPGDPHSPANSGFSTSSGSLNGIDRSPVTPKPSYSSSSGSNGSNGSNGSGG